MALEEDDDEFFDAQIDHQELRKAISNIIGGIVKSSSEEKKALLSKISDTVDKIDIYELKLVINSQGLEKAINKELFTKFIEEALENLMPEDVVPEIIEKALQSVEREAISNIINNNKGPLDNLVNYFKSASANEKIGMASAVMVLGAAFSPLIVLATLIALVAIGARYVGIGIGKAGEKIKEGAIDAGKAVKSSYKDLIDKLPIIQARENNFDKFKNDLSGRIIEIDTAQKREGIGEDETKNNLSNNLKMVKMLQNKEQLMAIKELIKDGTIKKFSEDDMSKLLEKGTSTHLDDQKPFDDLIDKLQSAIMPIGNNKIEEVEKIVDDKVKGMKPSPEVKNPSSEQVDGNKMKK
ncbi:hypothetical protein [Wolbachia endosymbiont (group B) of Episyrphus balteatus]|uniref:hypothetical protein n=1 Tax=Wolbachia endosymbiont (group B) of Episyrphus balteatus TaxID=2954009 RepID=UPI00222683E1|nr:hypothetical protein [Wolbachia endosymbiont (group B) of Episyrphus balteatus]